MKKFFTRNLFLALIVCAVSLTAFAQTKNSPRERVSFNENWLFQKDDPAGAEGVLSYENIKDWVRSTGNEYVLTSNAEKSARPAGNIGENVAYTRENFDDAEWRKLDLPHDITRLYIRRRKRRPICSIRNTPIFTVRRFRAIG